MSLVRLAAVWAAALLMAAAALVGLARIVAGAPRLDIPPVPIVAIGSSAFRYAFPSFGAGAQSALGDGRAHVRLAKAGISEAESLRLLEQALKGPAQTILLEIHPFAFDFADAAERSARSSPKAGTGWSLALLAWSHDLERNLARARHDAGRRPIDEFSREADADRPFHIDRKELQLHYPLRLREPYHEARLAELIGRARAKHVAIVLVALPRALSAAPYFRDGGTAELQSHFTEVARRLGLPLFATETFWPDAFFIDNGHLNRTGRARFLNELRLWWKRHHAA